MNLTKLTTRDLQKISRLIERKEALAEQIQSINLELGSMASSDGNNGGQAISKRRATKVKSRKKASSKAASGGRREQIIEALKGAGKEGIQLKDIAAKTGMSKNNVNVWFYTTAKKIPNIQKAGPGRFRWKDGK